MTNTLIYILPDSPITALLDRKYTPYRFYIGSVILLAKRSGCNRVFVVSHNVKKEHLPIQAQVNREDLSNDKLFEINESVKFARSEGVDLQFHHSDEGCCAGPDDIVLFGILNNKVTKVVHDTLSRNKVFIETAKGYFYLNSDCELTNTAYCATVNPKSEFMYLLRERLVDQVFQDKLLGIINTESPYDTYQKELKEQFNCPVMFLPMVLLPFQCNTAPMIIEDVPKSKGIRFLRGFERWTSFTRMLEFIRTLTTSGTLEVDWYESSLPAARAKHKPIMDKYGITYKSAQQWTYHKNLENLSQYKFISGLSLPTNHRMTYKIAESCLANRMCILPTISTEGMTTDHAMAYGNSKGLFLVHNDIQTTTDLGREMSMIEAIHKATRLSDSDYIHHVNQQKLFMKNYHSYFAKANEVAVDRILEVIKSC